MESKIQPHLTLEQVAGAQQMEQIPMDFVHPHQWTLEQVAGAQQQVADQVEVADLHRGGSASSPAPTERHHQVPAAWSESQQGLLEGQPGQISYL